MIYISNFEWYGIYNYHKHVIDNHFVRDYRSNTAPKRKEKLVLVFFLLFLSSSIEKHSNKNIIKHSKVCEIFY